MTGNQTQTSPSLNNVFDADARLPQDGIERPTAARCCGSRVASACWARCSQNVKTTRFLARENATQKMQVSSVGFLWKFQNAESSKPTKTTV